MSSEKEDEQGLGCWESEVDAAYRELMAELQEACEGHVQTVRRTLHLMVNNSNPELLERKRSVFSVDCRPSVLERVWKSYEEGGQVTRSSTLYLLLVLCLLNGCLFFTTYLSLAQARDSHRLLDCLFFDASTPSCSLLPSLQGAVMKYMAEMRNNWTLELKHFQDKIGQELKSLLKKSRKKLKEKNVDDSPVPNPELV